jgi:M6 family metalloprotease-like protein
MVTGTPVVIPARPVLLVVAENPQSASLAAFQEAHFRRRVMNRRYIRQSLACSIVISASFGIHLRQAGATPPPSSIDAPIPAHILEGLRNQSTRRGFINLTRTVRANLAAVQSGVAAAGLALGGSQVSGQRFIPVLMGKFSNTGNDPFPIVNLQRALFDGPSTTGTMTDFYKEISYGNLNVTGTVFPWKTLPNSDIHYAGAALPNGKPCNGFCGNARMGEFLIDLLNKNVDEIDFTKYDNDGPDGIPNSGDDDGFVDFVALVHPESGGECSNDNIWSHRSTLTAKTGSSFETKSVGKNGQKIRIDDYVIMPAKACDGTTMIQIGVFAHEFGHAFGLPDLYDTQEFNGKSEGIGNWGLMGAGSWGGDNRHPEKPSHMSAWEKEFLGWVAPREIKTDAEVVLRPVETQPDVAKVRISESEYYLLEYRQKSGFDVSLTGQGLAIWRINEPVVSAGLGNNTVNGDENSKGVGLVEADGLKELDMDSGGNRGNAGDIFPFLPKRNFDSTTTPRSAGRVAICDIGDPGQTIKFKVFVSRDSCN